MMEQFKDVNRRKSKPKEKLNIAMFGQKRIPSREGGVEIVVEELCTRMVAQGHNVTCYNRGGHHVSGSEYDSKRLKEYKGIKLKTVPTIEKKGLAAVSSSFFAALCCAFGKYDVVHIHAEGPAFFAWLPKMFGKKVIVTIHGLDWQREKWKGGFGSKFIHQGEKNAVKYADEIIVLSKGVQDFTKQFTNRFGSHVHILDWALHLDEGTPHIHERHVFDCENKYGEICPQQEKALEELGIALPKPDKPKGRNNNRKQTFDAICRTMFFDITRKYGLHLEEEPSYGGRDYLEKQDYILFKQKEQMKNQTEILDTLTLKIEEVEALIDEVSDIAYDKAVEVVTDEVRVETHKEDIRLVEQSKAWVLSPERKASQKERTYAASRLDGVITKITKAMQTAVKTIQTTLIKPEVKKVNTEQIKKKARSSILDRLAKAKITAEQENRERWEHEGRTKLGRNDMEL